jgi:hypothetical protein
VYYEGEKHFSDSLVMRNKNCLISRTHGCWRFFNYEGSLIPNLVARKTDGQSVFPSHTQNFQDEIFNIPSLYSEFFLFSDTLLVGSEIRLAEHITPPFHECIVYP